ncbi:MAG: hypothetical protein ACOYLH_07725 [Flavobacteriales bacterium]
MNRYIVFFIGCLLLLPQRGQTQIIHGYVLDAFDQRPIPETYVHSRIQEVAAYTDSLGFFQVRADKFPIEIKVSRMGYREQSIRLYNADTVIVFLQPSSFLDPVIVQAQNASVVAGNERRSIWSYAWCNDQLVICDYSNSLKDARLVLLSEDQDTLAKCPSPVTPVEMFSDCLGNAHLQGKDSTYQVVFYDDSLGVLPGEGNFMINYFLRRCVAQDDFNLYFAINDGDSLRDGGDGGFNYRTHDYEMWYFRGSKALGERHLFCKVTDEFALKMKKEESSFGHSPFGQTSMESDHSLAASRVFFDKILLKKIYAPLFVVDREVVILDHANNVILKYAPSGKLQSKVTMYYGNNLNFKQQCIQDGYTQRIYALFEEKGKYFLKEVFTATGHLGESIFIEHAFPENITIRNGFVYYLHRDRTNHATHLLSRQKL